SVSFCLTEGYARNLYAVFTMTIFIYAFGFIHISLSSHDLRSWVFSLSAYKIRMDLAGFS
ncbi:MAG TPA: hypothetical protein VL945_00205, partial [Candidatus Saccharimonadales bacterium]|nr:hypothetical protein [Candidatus Saccharimonadales bacterium]